jgi:hypothetical protein
MMDLFVGIVSYKNTTGCCMLKIQENEIGGGDMLHI